MSGLITDAEKRKALIADIILNVCEIPDRASPDDEPTALICSPNELESCIERALEKHFFQPVMDQDGDVLVSLGDMRGFSLKQIQEIDSNHEGMVEEHIKVFNYAVTQGIHPGQALFAMVQALATLKGFAIRSGMSPEVAGQMIALIVKIAQQSAVNVQIVIPH